MLEQKIEALTAVIERLIAALPAGVPAVSPVAPPAAPAPVAPPAYVPPAVPAAAPAMPAGPDFTVPNFGAPAPVAPAAAAGAPFSDLKGLIEYATMAYQALEQKQPGRGAQLQQVVTAYGIQQINELPVPAYPSFYQQVESLKAQP